MMKNSPAEVEVVDVAPRDGLQMLTGIVPTERKVRLIEALMSAGERRIEVASFVNPQRVPQMADAEEVVRRVRDGMKRAPLASNPRAKLMALVLNERGYERAKASDVDWICFVVTATETMSRHNAGMSMRDSLAECVKVIKRAKDDGLRVRGSIGVTWVCPYEGDVPPARVLSLAEEMLAAGADEIAFNDTVGRAHPQQVFELCAEAHARWSDAAIACHFHDTHHTALANIYAAWKTGVRVFDASVGGLGGCPFSPGASGNVATERVVWMLHRMNVATNIDETALKDVLRDLI